MRFGLPLSLLFHAAILIWALVSIGSTRALHPPDEVPVQVELLTVAEFSNLRAGSEKSKIKEKKAEPTKKSQPAEDPKKKTKRVAALEPTKTATPPAEEPKKEEPKKEEPKKTEPKADPIADVLKKLPTEEEAPKVAAEEPKKVAAKTEEPKKEEPKKEPVKKEEPKKETKKVEPKKEKKDTKAKKKPKVDIAEMQALLNKLPNASSAPAAETDMAENAKPAEEAIGSSQPTGDLLTITEKQAIVGALRRQIQQCWTVPNGGQGVEDIIVKLGIQLNPDGSVVGAPRVINAGGSTMFPVAAENAIRAVLACQPYTLPPELFDHWRAVNLTFDPKQMFGG